MNEYVKSVQELYNAKADPVKAGEMKAYMKDKFDFLGILTTPRRNLSASLLNKQNMPEVNDIPEIVKELWSLPQREFHYFAMELLGKSFKKMPADTIELYEYLLVIKSWWDTVDLIAAKLIGYHFSVYPAIKEAYLPKWRKSSNFWLRRSCILFQLKYKQDTDTGLLAEIIKENVDDKEFFIRKAIGWALREYAKTNPEWVIEFCNNTSLSPLSLREALKNIT